MTNIAYKVKNISTTDLEKIDLYKLNPKTKSGTENILVKVTRIDNKRFPEMDIYNIFYAKATAEGEKEGEFKLYKYIETEDNGLSMSSIDTRYPGVGPGAVKDYFEEYSSKYEKNPIEFEKILGYLKKKSLLGETNPSERNHLNSLVKIMTDIKSGNKSVPKLENKKVQETIEKLFSSLGDGYELTSGRPKRQIELESIKRTKKLFLENKKFLKILEAEEEKKRKRAPEWDEVPAAPKQETTPPKSKGFSRLTKDISQETPEPEIQKTPLPRSNRFAAVLRDENQDSTEQGPKKPSNVDAGRVAAQTSVGRSRDAGSRDEQLNTLAADLNTRKLEDSQIAVAWAQDENGVPCKANVAHTVILASSSPIMHTHVREGSNLSYAIVWINGKLDELSGTRMFYDRPSFVKYNKEYQDMLLKYFKIYGQDSPQIQDCIPWIEKEKAIPVNPQTSTANLAVAEAVFDKTTNKINWKSKNFSTFEALLRGLTTPKRKGGLGATSFVRMTTKKKEEPNSPKEIEQARKGASIPTIDKNEKNRYMSNKALANAIPFDEEKYPSKDDLQNLKKHPRAKNLVQLSEWDGTLLIGYIDEDSGDSDSTGKTFKVLRTLQNKSQEKLDATYEFVDRAFSLQTNIFTNSQPMPLIGQSKTKVTLDQREPEETKAPEKPQIQTVVLNDDDDVI